jgi:hypothetical protein
MRYPILFISLFIGLFFLSNACNAPAKDKKTANFDFHPKYIKNLVEGDSLSQAYLEAFIRFQRGDSLANIPFSLAEADTLYRGDDQYTYPIIPLKYVLSTDSNTDFLREEDITYNRVPQLSTASLQVYEANQWAKNIRIYTHLFNSRDKHPLLIIENSRIFSFEYRIFAPQKNGFWKLLKTVNFSDEDDYVFFHGAILATSITPAGDSLYTWHEKDFVMSALPFPYLYSPASYTDNIISKNALLHDIHIFGNTRYSAHAADTIEMSYIWDLRANILLPKGDTSFLLAQRNVVPKNTMDTASVQPNPWQRIYFEKTQNHWQQEERSANAPYEDWHLFAQIDSLQSTWVWDSLQKAYTCTQIGDANGLFSQHLKKAWDTDKLLCLNDPEKFKTLAVPPFEELSRDYKKFTYSDSLVQIGWQMIEAFVK